MALGATLGAGACTTPQAASPGAQMAAANGPNTANGTIDPNQVICSDVETTGSRLPQKECHTAHEWAVIREQGGEDLQTQAQRHMSADKGN